MKKKNRDLDETWNSLSKIKEELIAKPSSLDIAKLELKEETRKVYIGFS